MNPKKLKKMLSLNGPDFEQCVKNLPYEEKGITNFEGLCIWSLIKEYGVNVIVESGVSRARSTEMFGMFMNPLGIDKIYAFEKSTDHERYVRSKLSKYPSITYQIGDSFALVKNIIPDLSGKNVGAFIDGPKKGTAYIALMESLSQVDNLSFIVSHDCYIGSPTLTSLTEGYNKYFKEDYDLFFTDIEFDPEGLTNASLRKKVSITHPEKLQFLDKNCYYIGVVARKEK